ncbi:MAG: endonuclease/exonuclease/phosphatase family protein [Muribaculum sp.]|nr:endonuclease/exonuclease/phosphatase family protein [Muribaculaceae bacterium]MCM1081421.1 endonuclease/exonuclease/phosphatase family protein [Muribaculum sp.]
MTILNLLIKRRLALYWLIALLACIGPILTFCPLNISNINANTKKTDSSQFTLLTYNTLEYVPRDTIYEPWGNRTIAYILADSADILCVQEGASILQQNASQTDSLKAFYPYISPHNYKSSNLVLSRYPLTKIDLPQQPWESGSYQAYWVDVPMLEQPLLLVNCHLESFQLTPDDKSVYVEMAKKENASRDDLRQVKVQVKYKLIPSLKLHGEQSRSIAKMIDSINPVNIIVCGDFNDVCGSYAYRYLRNNCNLQDAYANTAFGPIATYNDSKLYFHIDQILYRGNFKAKSIMKGSIRTSDHYPLTTLFQCDKR